MAQQDLTPAKTKKLFIELVNISDKKNMYPVVPDDQGGSELYQTMNDGEFRPKHEVKYEPPPVVKSFPARTSFVHNCIANKNKSNISHFENIYNKKVFNPKKFKILRWLHAQNIDFRRLTMLKNELFDYEDADDNMYIPMEHWNETIAHFDDLHGCIDVIKEEVEEGGKINMQKLTDLVDLFYFLPITVQKDKNNSSKMFMVMSSNTQNQYTIDNRQGGNLKRMLDMLHIKLSEKFRNLAEAYRYFDQNFNNRVSFAEFQATLDALRIKYQVEQMDEIFQYLDKDQKGYVSYQDFCELLEERRRHLDTFDYEQNKKAMAAKDEGLSWLQAYLDKANLADLEKMSKLITLNGTKIQKNNRSIIHSHLKNRRMSQGNPDGTQMSFGRPSGLEIRDPSDLTMIMKNEFMKDYLKETITTRMKDKIEQHKIINRDWQNKGFKLRSQSVAHQIKQKDNQRKIKNFKEMNNTFRVSKDDLHTLTNGTWAGASISELTKKGMSAAHKTHNQRFFNEPLAGKLPKIENARARASSTMDKYDDSGISMLHNDHLNPVQTPVTRNSTFPEHSNSVVIQETTAQDDKNKFLNELHKMRMDLFEQRTSVDAQNEKPYLPMLSSDEKELIMEQYYKSKKKLNIKA